MKNKKNLLILLIVVFTIISFTSCNDSVITLPKNETQKNQNVILVKGDFDYSKIPEFNGSDSSIDVNNNVPFFTKKEKNTKKSFEKYENLDELGRCGVAVACVGRDIQPTAPRGSIGMIKPSGWHTYRFDDIVDGKYLYNRCHLIGYQLTGENANVKNLITGTRYLNVEGMLPYENMVDDYLEQYDNHVMYRVTPVFISNELVARGVLMEAYSVEDKGKGVSFCVFCYNNQPMIDIDYLTGEAVRK